jgi:predicted nucleic acid-binding protein
MCVVIDTCSFHRVFSKGDDALQALAKWVTEGPGKVVYGGTKYFEELAAASRYLQLVTELERAQRAVRIDSRAVDARQAEIENDVKERDFDDPHLIALVDESGCRIICTHDRRAERFIKRNALYKKTTRPAIYKEEPRHAHLIREQNIVKCCR